MKWFLHPCRCHRQSLCLLASGLLAGQDKVRIESHLAGCADCRSYYDEIKTVTAPLAGWEKHFADIEPGTAVHLRLAKAIASANQSESVRPLAPKIVLLKCWQQLILPCRRIWAGLAAVWVLLLAVNVSTHTGSQMTTAKSSPTPEMIQAWRQQERLLAELIGPTEPHAAMPPKTYLPQPGSQRRFEMLTV